MAASSGLYLFDLDVPTCLILELPSGSVHTIGFGSMGLVPVWE